MRSKDYSKASIKIKAPIALIWEILVMPENWMTASPSVIDFRRDNQGKFKLGETFEHDLQYETGDPVDTYINRVSELIINSRLRLEATVNNNEQELIFDLEDFYDYTKITVSVLETSRFEKYLLMIFFTSKANLIKSTVLKKIKLLAQENLKN